MDPHRFLPSLLHPRASRLKQTNPFYFIFKTIPLISIAPSDQNQIPSSVCARFASITSIFAVYDLLNPLEDRHSALSFPLTTCPRRRSNRTRSRSPVLDPNCACDKLQALHRYQLQRDNSFSYARQSLNTLKSYSQGHQCQCPLLHRSG